MRRSKGRDPSELRAEFISNRERVRNWTGQWYCPEVDWPAFREIPLPWIVRAHDRDRWLERDAPFLQEYEWLVEAIPTPGTGVSEVFGHWRFGPGHVFEGLDVEMQSWADPDYLADRLSRAAHAAALDGWRAGDLQDMFDWLIEGLNTRPIGDLVQGQRRVGTNSFELKRWPAPLEPDAIKAKLSIKPTTTTLSGAPLTADDL